jgi:hypothetical protein
MTDLTPRDWSEAEAMQVAETCSRELAGPRWSNDARADLREIRMSALGVIDHAAGHEGFEGAYADMERRLGEWADDVDYRTFARPTRRHLADRRKAQELTARDRRNAGRRAVEDWMKL